MTNLTEKWINIYKHKNSYWCGTPHHTKTEALLYLADTENYLTTVNIEQLLKLQEENTKLKVLLKEIRGKLHYINTPVNRHNIFSNDFIKKLDQVLGEE